MDKYDLLYVAAYLTGSTPDGTLGKDTDSHIHALHLASNHTV